MKRLLIIFLIFFPLFASAQLSATGSFFKKKPAPYAATVDYEAVGAQGSGTTSCTPAYPTVAVGNGLIMAVGVKDRYAKVETPSGWFRRATDQDMNQSAGGDVGEVGQIVFWKEATGFESGTVTVSCSSCSSMNAVIYAFSKDSNARWDVDVTSGTDETAGTTYSVTSKKDPVQSRVNDLLFIVSSLNTDAYALVDQAVTQTGATFSTLNAEIGEYPTTAGNDQEQVASVFRVTAASVVPAKMVYTMTASGSAASNPLGTTHFIQLRQYFAYQDLPPSTFHSWVAANVVDNTYSGDGSSIWDGKRTSITSTGTVSGAGFAIENFNGRACFKFSALIQDATNYWTRAEVSDVPWQPRRAIGTQVIYEVRYETPSSPATVYREFDIMQCHTGTEPGGPWPLNSPLFYIAFAYPGQAGWQNGTPSGNGQIGIVLTTPDPDIRFLTDVEWDVNSTYRVLVHVKFDYAATGDPCFKVGIAKDGGPMTWVFEEYDEDTVFQDDDIATHGAPAHVGGAFKIGVYNHTITSGTAASNSIAAGNTGYTLYVPEDNMIVLVPSDPDYITDVTDNNHPYYQYVSTASE